MGERHTRVRASQIRSILPDDLEATNALGSGIDGYVAIYDSDTEKFTWAELPEGSTGGNSYKTTFTDSDLSSGNILTVTHNLGEKYCLVQIYDENDKKANPDDIELVDSNNLNVDLSTFGTISGTWHIIIVS